MATSTLQDAFVDELKDLLHAERQLSKALPKMAKCANSPALRAAFEEHLHQTNGHITRLEQVFQNLDVKPKSKKCDGIAGIIDEGEKLLKKDAEPSVQDAMLIAAAQKAEHYEIASYGTVCAWAGQLGNSRACELLGETLSEEKLTDDKLTKLAESINTAATVA